MSIVDAATPGRQRQPFFFELSRLMIIGINLVDNLLVYKAQTKPNGPYEADWTPISRSEAYDIMAAGLAKDGRVVAIAQTRSNPTVHFYIECPDEMRGTRFWEPPVNLGLPHGVPGFRQLVTRRDDDGRIEIFGLAANSGHVWWIFQNPDRIVTKQVTVIPPGQTQPITVTVQELAPPLTPWSSWQQLAPRKLDVLTAANDGDGRIALAGSVLEGAIPQSYYTQQKIWQALKPSDWTSWVDMGHTIKEVAAPDLRLDPLGVLNVFGKNVDDVVQTRQSPPGANTFARWARPGMTGQTIREIATGIDGDDHIVVVAADKNANVHANVMVDVECQQWWGWQQIARAPGNGPLTLDYNADGRLTLFLREETGSRNLWCMSQMAFNSNSWEAAWTPLSTKGLAHYGVVHDLTPPTQ